ncbi:MAG: 4,5-DOPA dioxygenase extradiol [Chryseobacterium sp.]|nr:MAG: 4,5-DOPA dioxygenase extradiol [Chryseobacterium sp.]
MPLLFIGHGHPINALLDNDFTRSLTKVGCEIEKPEAILVISAHWETNGTFVSINPAPRTIYDFGNFNSELYGISYPAKGAPRFAQSLIDTVQTPIGVDTEMGLDHGAWTVLKYLRPAADVPVFEMSLHYGMGPAYHFALGKELRCLRDKGVLIVCSGNIVHNLAQTDWRDMDAKPHDWVLEFDELVKKYLTIRAFNKLVDYQNLGTAARLSIPTNDHYLPMIYSLGLADEGEEMEQFYEGYQFAAMSMRCFKIG